MNRSTTSAFTDCRNNNVAATWRSSPRNRPPVDRPAGSIHPRPNSGRVRGLLPAILMAALAVSLGWTGAAAGADDARPAAFVQSVADARRAMAQRDLDEAARHLQAATQTAKTQAQ